MRKALILGIGGTGGHCVNRLRDLMEWRQNKHIGSMSNIQYLELDADRSIMPESDVNLFELTVPQAAVDKFKREHVQESIHKWADIEALEAATDGSSRTRSKGKFTFMYHYNDIEDAIKLRLKNLYESNTEDISAAAKKKIYIIANSVSGTGSGCFVDCGYMIRKIIREAPEYRSDPLLNITLILTLPASMDNSIKLRNTYYALEELNHYMSDNAYTFEHVQNPGQVIKEAPNVHPFDFVYLIGPQRGQTSESGSLEKSIGEYLYNDIFSPSADVRDAHRDNMNLFLRRRDAAGYSRSYMTFGFSTIEYPAIQISRAAAYSFLENQLRQFLPDESIGNLDYAYGNIFLNPGSHKDSGTIYNQLLKDVSANVIDGGSYNVDILKMIDGIKSSAYDNFIDDGMNTQYLRDLIETIDRGFNSSKFGFTDGQYGDGSVDKVIQKNIDLLKGQTDEGWERIIKGSLLNAMFSRSHGLRLVKQLITEIIDRLTAICERTEPGGDASDMRSEMRDICVNIDALKNDPLLRIGWLYKMPINDLYRDFQDCMDRYVSFRLNAATVRQAKALAKAVRAKMESFGARIDKFADAIITWRNRLKTDYQEVCKPQPLNGHVIMQNEIATLADILKQNAPIDYGQVMSFLRGTYENWLFATDDNPLREKDKSSIEDGLRAAYYSRLGSKNVIDEFILEEEIKAQLPGADPGEAHNPGRSTVARVDGMSKLYISMTITDPLAITDSELTKAKWFFYPGGKNAGANNFTSPFAQILRSLAIVKNWTEQSYDSFDTYTIMFLEEKGCFALRYLDLLSDPKMREALDQITETDSAPNTYLARMDVDFLPLKMISGERMDELKIAFIVSVLTGALQAEESGFVYRDKRTVKSVFNTTNRSIRVPRLYKSAIYKLQKEPQENLNTLKKFNDKYISENQTEFLLNLHSFIADPMPSGIWLNNPEMDKADIERLLAEEFLKPRPALFEAWNAAFPDDTLEHASYNFEYVHKGEKEGYINQGFYCTVCHQFIKDALNLDGAPDYSKIPELKKQHSSCNR